MTRLGKKNNFGNIFIDACWLARSGQTANGMEVLRNKFPQLASQDIKAALAVGDTLNHALWDLSVKHWQKEIDKKTVRDAILAICPDLTDEMLDHLYDNAMYDSM